MVPRGISAEREGTDMDNQYLIQYALPGEKTVSWQEQALQYCGRIDREREDGALMVYYSGGSHMHPGIAGGIVDVHVAVLPDDGTVGKHHIGELLK